MNYPKISIITPSLNQGEFLEDTILSVLGQNYPNLEYIIMDGGSTDNSIDIIKKYETQLAYWISEKDKGQADALNKGFRKSTGDILAWINSDDMYMPNILKKITTILCPNELNIIYGQSIHTEYNDNRFKCWGSNILNQESTDLTLIDYIIQPSTFWTREVWKKIGELNTEFHYGFDWEWYIRAKNAKINFIPINKTFSIYRIHNKHKTGDGSPKRMEEIIKIYETYNKKYKKLTDKLLNEKICSNSILYKLIRKTLNFIKLQSSYGNILKICKQRKYKNYSTMEINFVISMLLLKK